MAESVRLGQIFFRVLQFLTVTIILPMFRTSFILLHVLMEGQASEIWQISHEAMTFRLSESSGQKILSFLDAADTHLRITSRKKERGLNFNKRSGDIRKYRDYLI